MLTGFRGNGVYTSYTLEIPTPESLKRDVRALATDQELLPIIN